MRVFKYVLHDASSEEHIDNKESFFTRSLEEHSEGSRDEDEADQLLQHENVGLVIIEGNHVVEEAFL